MKDVFSSTMDQAMLDTAWKGIGARRERRRIVRRVSVALPVALALAIALLVFIRRPSHAPEAIMLANGAAPPAAWILPTPETVTLDDGSRLELGAKTTLRTVARTPSRVELALENGSTTFDIVPGGPRAWSIDAGGGTFVRVLGTRFTVTREGERVQVSVERGKVRVESPKIAGGVRDLVAGQSVDLDASQPVVAKAPASPPVVDVPVADTKERSDRESVIGARERSDRESVIGARERSDRESVIVRPTKKIAAPLTSADPPVDPMARADAARREGRPRDATAILRGIVDAGDPRAALAAFTIGKIHAEELGEPAVAASWFERAMRLGLPAALDEDAQARVAESYGRAGRADDAARAAARYESRFPNGRHLARVRRWLRD